MPLLIASSELKTEIGDIEENNAEDENCLDDIDDDEIEKVN